MKRWQKFVVNETKQMVVNDNFFNDIKPYLSHTYVSKDVHLSAAVKMR